MKKKKSVFALIVLLLSFVMMEELNFVKSVWGLETQQTVPTRTPTPLPPTATQSGGGGGNNPTNTPSSHASPTATSTLLPVKIAPTPVGGFLPTAVPCSDNPTIQTLGATNVRSGPGLAYDVIGELVYLEVRYIVGRAESAEWWLIQFNNGQFGWVADEIVLVQGYTPIVPGVEAPPLNGGTPTPGPAWNPTPIPFCTVTPAPTETATAVPTTPDSALAEAIPTETPTEPAATEIRPTDTPIAQPTAVPLNPTATPATATTTSDTPDEGGSGGIILLVAGLLLGVGLVIVFLRQRR